MSLEKLYLDTRDENIEFEKNVDYINGYYAENSIELKKALMSAISDGGAALIEVKVDKNLEKSPWKYILMTY